MTLVNTSKRRIIIWVIVAVFPLFSQSPASSLGNYKLLFTDTISGISSTNISAVTFHPGSKTLYIIDNKECAIYEINTKGRLIRKIRLDGFEDPEGIAYYNDCSFYIVEERRADLSLIHLQTTGNSSVARESGSVLHFGDDWKNSGLEGVAYTPATNLVTVVKEKKPPRLYCVWLDSSGNPVRSEKNKPFNIEHSSGDASDLFALTDGNFLVVNQELDKLVGFDPGGNVLSELVLGMGGAEGVTVDTSGSIYIVGEPKQLCIFGR